MSFILYFVSLLLSSASSSSSIVHTTYTLPFYGVKLAVASLGSKVMFAGGFTNNMTKWNPKGSFPVTETIAVYNELTGVGQWESVKQLKPARCFVTAVSSPSKAFFVGGITEKKNISCAINIYDLPTNTWSYDELPEARLFAGLAIKGDELYVAGGWGYHGLSSVINVYNYRKKQWLKSLSLPEKVFEVVGSTVGDTILFHSGAKVFLCNDGGDSMKCKTLNTKERAGVAVAGELFAGGIRLGMVMHIEKTVEWYDASQEELSTTDAEPLKVPLGYSASVMVESSTKKMAVFAGGVTEWELSDMVDSYIKYDYDDKPLRPQNDPFRLSVARALASAGAAGSKIVVAGGFSISTQPFSAWVTNVVDLYDVSKVFNSNLTVCGGGGVMMNLPLLVTLAEVVMNTLPFVNLDGELQSTEYLINYLSKHNNRQLDVQTAIHSLFDQNEEGAAPSSSSYGSRYVVDIGNPGTIVGLIVVSILLVLLGWFLNGCVRSRSRAAQYEPIKG